jgi:Ca2+-binding RTX toxin-like protein
VKRLLPLGLVFAVWLIPVMPLAAASQEGRGCTVRGTPGPDDLTGTHHRDVICGLGGRDLIQAEAGNDLIYGGRGSDDIGGAGGGDKIYGGAGADQISGETGQNVIFGGRAADRISAGPQKSRVYGQSGRDFIYVTGTRHGRLTTLVSGGPGNDRCLDTRFFTPGDIILGGRGRDRYEADPRDSVQGVERFVFCYP